MLGWPISSRVLRFAETRPFGFMFSLSSTELSTSSLVVPLLLFVGVFLCLNFFVGRFCAVTFLVCVEFEVLLMPYSVVLGLSPFTVCLVLASSLSRAAAAISFLRACF